MESMRYEIREEERVNGNTWKGEEGGGRLREIREERKEKVEKSVRVREWRCTMKIMIVRGEEGEKESLKGMRKMVEGWIKKNMKGPVVRAIYYLRE